MGFLARLQIQVFDILDGLLWCIKELLSTTNRPKDLGRIHSRLWEITEEATLAITVKDVWLDFVSKVSILKMGRLKVDNDFESFLSLWAN